MSDIQPYRYTKISSQFDEKDRATHVERIVATLSQQFGQHCKRGERGWEA